MVHRDPTFAGRTGRLCASPTAGIDGRSSPGCTNRIREYRKPSSGSRFRKTERNGNADDAWGCPFSHGPKGTDGTFPHFFDPPLNPPNYRSTLNFDHSL